MLFPNHHSVFDLMMKQKVLIGFGGKMKMTNNNSNKTNNEKGTTKNQQQKQPQPQQKPQQPQQQQRKTFFGCDSTEQLNLI